MTAAGGVRFSDHDGEVPAAAAAVVDTGLGQANDAAAPLHEVRAMACFAYADTAGDGAPGGQPGHAAGGPSGEPSGGHGDGAAGDVIGGAVGRRWGRCCELQQLWVSPPQRRTGLGTALLRRFEALAQAQGCVELYLDTFSFQAPDFYRALGYDSVHRNALFPHGIVRHAMHKTLRPEPHVHGSAAAPPALRIRRVDAGATGGHAPDALADGLGALLADAVAGGASVGFLRPLADGEARAWAAATLAGLGPALALWVAEDDAGVVGSVQLAPCLKPNGRHRAELMKLLVHRRARGRGIATALLAAVEAQARADGLQLLVLDTEAGSPAEGLYRRLGWRYGGSIPGYALTPDGTPHATVYLYRELTAAPAA